MTTSTPGFKKVGAGDHRARVSRLSCLEKLSAVLRMLGSTAVPVWFFQDEEGREPFVQHFDDVWLEMMKKILEDGDGSFSESKTVSFWRAYYTLGAQTKDNVFRLLLTSYMSRRVQRHICPGLGPIMETLQAPRSDTWLDQESQQRSQTKSLHECT